MIQVDFHLYLYKICFLRQNLPTGFEIHVKITVGFQYTVV